MRESLSSVKAMRCGRTLQRWTAPAGYVELRLRCVMVVRCARAPKSKAAPAGPMPRPRLKVATHVFSDIARARILQPDSPNSMPHIIISSLVPGSLVSMLCSRFGGTSEGGLQGCRRLSPERALLKVENCNLVGRTTMRPKQEEYLTQKLSAAAARLAAPKPPKSKSLLLLVALGECKCPLHNRGIEPERLNAGVTVPTS